MLKHKIFVLKAICFSLILFTVITQVNYILTPKKYFDDEWPTTATFHGFYQMPKNSVDVLLLGSSHMASGLIPQSIYNSYGITSYNLGCEQQNLLISYYWLQEALRFQTPKVVVLDAYMLFEYNHLEPLNTSESSTRMAIDPMRWSPVKWNAVKDICTYDSNQTFNSYLFKNIRFHARWSSLTEQDFSFKKYESHYELRGYAPLNSKETKHSTDYEPYENYNTLWTTDMVPIMEQYLDKITELCKENNIPLILIKTPTSQWNIAKHNTTNEYAQKNNLTFWDFNEASLYADSHFDFTEDMSDVGHCNIWGAQKLSTYISQYLYQHYHIAQNTFHKYWSETDSYFQEIMQNCELKYITDIFQYIDAIQQDRYTIFISSQYDSSNFMDEVQISAQRCELFV